MYIEINSNLFLIPLDQEAPGFTSFISAWLYKGEKNVLIDVGPAATIPVLLNALKTVDVKSIDAVLLTHIHIDHAGGVGDFSLYFPNTPIVCHSSGIPHLEDPTRLWEGSLKTLGKTAQVYGPLRPVSKGVLRDAADFHEFGITPIFTPGHAPHHISYLVDAYLFGGEAGGVTIPLASWVNKGVCENFPVYLRPATPPKFFLETSLKSLDSLLNTPHELFCYGHFGAAKNSYQILKAHRTQLIDWAEIIREQMRLNPGKGFLDRCLESLLKNDPLLAGWNQLDSLIQERERGFLSNSIRGFEGYLAS